MVRARRGIHHHVETLVSRLFHLIIVLANHSRHCVLSRQLKNIKALAEDDPEKLTGFHNISTESQEQVKQAFENNAVDKEWSDVRTDLIKKGSGHVGEITNATSYKVDVATRCTAMCRNTACKDKGVKIKKGELRLGIATMYDGHESWGYKHW
jgi:hypothetical protein